jgi:A/G-specific adenine glycosylase
MSKDFSDRLIAWQHRHGRHDLPWQNTRDPYRVWLSEVMLQQTQVATVIPYYLRFLAHFPTLGDLAAAPVEDVMALWSGLGYYARARNLHHCARTVQRDHGGAFPHDPLALAGLPGIGRSTANSIATFCFDAQAPILDGNVKRVLCRAFGIEGVTGSAAVEKRLWALADELMPRRDGAIYNQAQMDLGAMVCTRSKPICIACPLDDICVARATNRVDELPQRKPRKLVPEREATLLIVLDEQGRVLLETRPPAGIWGGLQSLPELPAAAEPVSWSENRLGCRVTAVSPAPTFWHVFSHFRLHITPLVLQVTEPTMMMEAGSHWLAADELARAALPAPVRTLLTQIVGSKSLLSRKR